jgi:putative flippase GtrA
MYKGVSPEISNILGYVVGIAVSFLLNKRYTFKAQGDIISQFLKFGFSMGICYAANLLTLIILFRILGVNSYISQILAGAVYTMTGYILSKNWVFRVLK